MLHRRVVMLEIGGGFAMLSMGSAPLSEAILEERALEETVHLNLALYLPSQKTFGSVGKS